MVGNMAKIEIYTTRICSLLRDGKTLAETKQARFEEIDVTADNEERRDRAGQAACALCRKSLSMGIILAAAQIYWPWNALAI